MMKIKEVRIWNAEDVRAICVGRQLYTKGTSKEYDKMLQYVNNHVPTPKVLYRVAKNIIDHSVTGYEVDNLMYVLANEAVRYSFSVEED